MNQPWKTGCPFCSEQPLKFFDANWELAQSFQTSVYVTGLILRKEASFWLVLYSLHDFFSSQFFVGRQSKQETPKHLTVAKLAIKPKTEVSKSVEFQDYFKWLEDPILALPHPTIFDLEKICFFTAFFITSEILNESAGKVIPYLLSKM